MKRYKWKNLHNENEIFNKRHIFKLNVLFVKFPLFFCIIVLYYDVGYLYTSCLTFFRKSNIFYRALNPFAKKWFKGKHFELVLWLLGLERPITLKQIFKSGDQNSTFFFITEKDNLKYFLILCIFVPFVLKIKIKYFYFFKK